MEPVPLGIDPGGTESTPPTPLILTTRSGRSNLADSIEFPESVEKVGLTELLQFANSLILVDSIGLIEPLKLAEAMDSPKH